MSSNHFPPRHVTEEFTCPHCNVYTHQRWGTVQAGFKGYRGIDFDYIKISRCEKCEAVTIWVNAKMVYPDSSPAPLPNDDMPNDIKADYMEASSVFSRSSRSAAALLRLAIQKLLVELGESGKDINKDIGSLVKKGLSDRVQKALDVVRVVGNNAVHPGQIDINDTPEVASALFGLVNLIVEKLITEEKHVDELFSKLPQSNLDAIARRDAKP